MGLGGGHVAVVLASLFPLGHRRASITSVPLGRALTPGDLLHWIALAFAKNQYGLPIYANLLLVAIALAFVCALVLYRQRGPLLIALCLFAAMPLYSGLAHWFGSDQRNHWFGYWFGHDMFTPPFKAAGRQTALPGDDKDAVLFGGTDPGRFCPTYIIFCESFTPHNCQPPLDQNFDRRDVYIITQNALADGTYLCYIRAQYNRSTQIDPPFFSELLRDRALKDKDYQTNLLARAVEPLDRFFTALGARVEKRRRTYTSWFTDKDFTTCPPSRPSCAPAPQQDPLSKYLYDNLSPQTQQLLVGPGRPRPLAPRPGRGLERAAGARAQDQGAPHGQAAGEGRGGPGNRRRQRVRAAEQEAGAAQPRKSPSSPRPARSTSRSASSRCSFRNT